MANGPSIPYPGGSALGGAGTGGGGSAGLSKSFPAGMVGVKVRRGNVVKATNGCCAAFLSLSTFVTPGAALGGAAFLPVAGAGIGLAVPITGVGDVRAQILVNGPGRLLGIKLNADAAVQIGDSTAGAVALNVYIDGGTAISVPGTFVFGGPGSAPCIFVPTRGVRIPAGCHTLEIALNVNGTPTVLSLQATIFVTMAL